MFPNLDPTLIRALRADAPSEQSAVDTLLALVAAAAAEPHPAGDATPQAPAALPPSNIGLSDHGRFPSLVDAGGWQVVGHRQFELAEKLARGEEDDLGSAWLDQAKAAADIPAPPTKAWGPAKKVLAAGGKQGRRREEDDKEEGENPSTEVAEPMTDYEFRQHLGQQRARHRALFGRRGGRRDGGGTGGRGTGRGAATGRRSGSESELSEEGANLNCPAA